MPDTFIEFGERLESQDPGVLTIAAAIQTYFAVQAHPNFEIVEIRRAGNADSYSEMLVVDCTNDRVPTKNRIGIQYRERLGLRFFAAANKPPEVRALRKDFPPTAHQNHVALGEPASICLYFEPWSTVERTWTVQKHLARVLWWLAETANGSLHRPDQPVEHIYFSSEFELVLPPDFDEKAKDKSLSLAVKPQPLSGNECRVLIGSFKPVAEPANNKGYLDVSCVVLTLSPIVHGGIERIPATLGELHDRLEQRGAPVLYALFEEIRRLAAGDGLPKSNKGKRTLALLVLSIPIVRAIGSLPERQETKGFIIHSGLGELGVKGGALFENDGRYWAAHVIGTGGGYSTDWSDLELEPVDVLPAFTKERARAANGIALAGPSGVLAGAGALGSAIANMWQRQGWGTWTVIDPDHIKPHNLARHTAFTPHIGWYKTKVIASLEALLYPNQHAWKAIPASARNFENAEVANALDTADLVIDATTTLEFPRDLSTRSSVKRVASVFLTPSGLDSVLLMEDSKRAIRLDALEAQYYRVVINQPWGERHLIGNRGYLWAGAGCRDASAVIENELIQLHAATLVRQLRIKSHKSDAVIRVWHTDPGTGAVTVDQIAPAKQLVHNLESLKILWDDGLRTKVRQLRADKLPNETGGVLLGYFDLKLGHVYIVDALPAPPDSEGDTTGFTRGTSGLQDAVQRAQERTGGIVTYVGEWHSHPLKTSAKPSPADIYLLAHLASGLQADGLPAIMLIVGEHEERWLTGQGVE